MQLEQFVDRALTVPFVVGGRDWSGWDCWGLIFVAYQEIFDTAIPSLADEYDDKTSFTELNDLVNTQIPIWKTVDRPKFGDIRLFKISRYQSHVSLVLPGGLMIHALDSVGTAIERLDVLTWARRHVEYFRHVRGIGQGGASSAQD